MKKSAGKFHRACLWTLAGILFITIIGIPFARQHLKLMELSFMPFSRQVVS